MITLLHNDQTVSLEHSSCFSFNGNGYAIQRDFRNYDPRYLSISMEFKSFDANALLFFAANDQHVSIVMQDTNTQQAHILLK